MTIPLRFAYINLDSAVDRRATLTAELARLGVLETTTRIPGVLGAACRSLATADAQWWATDSMIGCWLAHRSAWEWVLANEGADLTCILEDDCTFSKWDPEEWRTALDRVTRATFYPAEPDAPDGPDEPDEPDETGDVLFLTNLLGGVPPSEYSVWDHAAKHVAVRDWRQFRQCTANRIRPEFVTGFSAYVVSRSSARRLLDWLPHPAGHIDIALSRVRAARLYCCYPDLAALQSTHAHTSSQTVMQSVDLVGFLTDHRSMSRRHHLPASYLLGMPLARGITGRRLIGLVVLIITLLVGWMVTARWGTSRYILWGLLALLLVAA